MSTSSSEVLQLVASLLDSIHRQDWQTFRSAVLSNPAYFKAVTKTIASCPELNGMTLLHAVARHNPPLDIVAKMISTCPKLPAARDCLNRTPLHVAAGSGASSKLIKLIAYACPASCEAQDEDGKTPLHYACDTSCELFEEDFVSKQQSRTPRQVCHDSIKALLSESLHAATIEDVDEMNPLEYAIMSDAHLNTVKMLQKASCKSFQSSSRSIAPRRVSDENVTAIEESNTPL